MPADAAAIATSKEYSKQHALKAEFANLFSRIKQDKPANLHRYAQLYFKASSEHAKEDQTVQYRGIAKKKKAPTDETRGESQKLYRAASANHDEFTSKGAAGAANSLRRMQAEDANRQKEKDERARRRAERKAKEAEAVEIKAQAEAQWTMHVKDQGQMKKDHVAVEMGGRSMKRTETPEERAIRKEQEKRQTNKANETPEERALRKHRERKAREEKKQSERARRQSGSGGGPGLLSRSVSKMDFSQQDYVFGLPKPPKTARGANLDVVQEGGGRQARRRSQNVRKQQAHDAAKRKQQQQQQQQKQQQQQQARLQPGGQGHGRSGAPNLHRSSSQSFRYAMDETGEAMRKSSQFVQQSFFTAGANLNKLHDGGARRNAEMRKALYEEKVKQAYRAKYGDHGSAVFEQMNEAVTDHPAIFTVLISVVMVCIMLHSILTQPVAKWGLGYDNITYTVDYYNGYVYEQTIPVAQNMWYGPNTGVMISYGAKYTPCMRQQDALSNKTKLAAETEMQYGGCMIPATSECWMSDQMNCDAFSSNPEHHRTLTWEDAAGVTRSPSNPTVWLGRGQVCPNTYNNVDVTIVGRPCCYGISNDCHILPENYCNVLGATGYSKWHKDDQLCSAVNCLEGLCDMWSLGSIKSLEVGGENGTRSDGDPISMNWRGGQYAGEDSFTWEIPNQFWRFFSPIFMHVGVGHLLFNLAFQVRAVAEIENLAGFRNTAIMYFLSGFGGNIFAATMESVSVSAGASSSLYGIIGVQTVDLFQSWQLLESPWSAFRQQMIMNIIVLGVGTLPQVDNWAHSGGFVVGVVTGIAYLPFIHFSKIDKYRKFILQNISKIVIGLGVLCSLVIFYTAKDPSFCTWCKYINCVPYTSAITCDVEDAQVDDEPQNQS